jgi:16S rRNA (guanine(966)-N(2))-methyltransferase RsmD
MDRACQDAVVRIIAGELGGRRLVAPRGLHTRPTADRVKEALFNILGTPAARTGERFRVLDLFCGSGALGLEALSRGADEAVLVDEERAAVEAAERNVEALGVRGRARVLRREVGLALRDLDGTFDWVFLDPPYDREHGGGALDRALRLLGGRPLVAQLACAEHDRRNPPRERYGRLALASRRSWGDTAVSFYRPATDETPVTDDEPERGDNAR